MSENNNKAKCMLIMPAFTQSKKAMKRCLFPLGLGYLAAVLEKEGIDVCVLDCIVEGYNTEVSHDDGEITFGLQDDEIKKRIREYNPDFVGVSCLLSRQAHNAHRVCGIAKDVNKSIRTIMGGCHPSALPEAVIADPNVDNVVIGEGEGAILAIVKGERSGMVRSDDISLEKLPWPARHLLPMEKYIGINMPTSVFSPSNRVTQIEFTRSCPFNCSFCATTQFRAGYRKREVNDCLAEVKFLKNKYRIEELDIIDSNFIVDKVWVKQLLTGLKELGISWANPGGIWVGGLDEEMLHLMKESGCYQLSLAVESSTPRILKDIINKPTKLDMVKPVVDICRKIGIDLHAFFICGFPEQTREEMNNDYRFAKEMGFTSASFNIISPLPGSRIYEKYMSEFDDIDLRKASIPHPDMSRGDIEKLVEKFNRSFNSSLIYRNPAMFFKKYVSTLLRKPSFNLLKKLFNRQ
ncbi:MAG: B12-binding domain-containing radical SAM protein [Elusimicrobia bacterium]|nr:B12-binding domain-containing radical SAM protein [Elusimicrobiota bacterium]